MKKQKQREHIRSPLGSKKGLGTVGLLIIMSVLITIVGAISGVLLFASKSAVAIQEETLHTVHAQSVFAYVDIAVEEQIQRIFENAKSTVVSAQQGGNNNGGREAELDKGQFTTEFMKELKKVVGEKKSPEINSLMALKGDVMAGQIQLKYLKYQVSLFQYDKNRNYFVEYKDGIINQLSDIALNIEVRYEKTKGNDIIFQKSYFLNLDEYMEDKPLIIEEAVIGGRELFYKS